MYGPMQTPPQASGRRGSLRCGRRIVREAYHLLPTHCSLCIERSGKSCTRIWCIWLHFLVHGVPLCREGPGAKSKVGSHVPESGTWGSTFWYTKCHFAAQDLAQRAKWEVMYQNRAHGAPLFGTWSATLPHRARCQEQSGISCTRIGHMGLHFLVHEVPLCRTGPGAKSKVASHVPESGT